MRKLIVTFFGTGLSPIAPGTVGSLAASLLLYAAYRYANPSWGNWQIVLAVSLLIACVLSIRLGTWAVLHFKKKDPQAFVLDEVAGICLTNLLLPISPTWNYALTPLLAFAAFRLFDVTKLPPIKLLEWLPGGWGILLDDLAAAVYASILCQILLRMVLKVPG
jgi:phosphatidylglycerophosphatase A